MSRRVNWPECLVSKGKFLDYTLVSEDAIFLKNIPMLPESRAELDFETFNGVIKNRNLKISTRVSMTKLVSNA